MNTTMSVLMNNSPEHQLTGLHRRKAALGMEHTATINFTKAWARARAVTTAINHEGTLHPTFARASQNMGMAAMLLDTLPAPSTDGANKVYRQLKNILGVATKQQAKSSLQQQAEASIQATWADALSRWCAIRLKGDEGVHIEHRACPFHHGRCSNRERCSLSTEATRPKACGSNMRDACFPKHFWAIDNIIKYDGKTNPSIWLEDYRLTCKVGGVDNDLFIIQFLQIYLANASRAWLDHLPRNSIDCWEDLKEIFTNNF
jgi:hypothetical protein